MKIAQSKTRENFPLSMKKVLKKTVASVLIYFLILIIIFSILVIPIITGENINSGNVLFKYISIFIILLFLVTLIIYFYQKWYYSVYFYDLNENYIIIKKGPITPLEITVPFERIQDVYVSQDLLDRFFGLYDVYISTATFTSGTIAHIDGVEKKGAEGLKNLILEKVKEKNKK